MQNLQTSAKQEEKSNIQNSVETPNKENYHLIERIKIENTPFEITGNKEIGFKFTWGRFNLSEKMQTEEEVIKWAEEHHWEITMSMVHIYIENYFTMKAGFDKLDDIDKK